MGSFGFAPIVGLFFLVVVGIILFAIIKGIAQWNYNNAQPVLCDEATVIAKRTSTSGGGNDTSVSTYYHVTFESSDGERREFSVGGQEYGLLAEHDQGTLCTQGTRYKGFTRNRAGR